ncbi:MAG: GvpL/GvpF family gas vesicle protein [Deltaproteobacteria bacterium]|nr:GvpL/GvpF family gas vesicle protein [Deltaproteobacteria bacterium]
MKSDLKKHVPAGLPRQASSRGIKQGEVRLSGGIYLYCIAEGDRDINFGRIGLNGSEVYAIRRNGLLAVVHDCKGDSCMTGDAGALRPWVITHNDVVDTAMETFDAVLPLGFGKIIMGEGGLCPIETLTRWFEKEYEVFRLKLVNVKGKEEYGVQVFWEPGVVTKRLAGESPEARSLSEEVKRASPGRAFMCEEKLKKVLSRETEVYAEGCFRDFYGRIKIAVDGIKIDKKRQTDDKKQVLMSLSCLVRKDGVDALKGILDGIKKRKGFSVRFTGPWAPYSFA